MSNLFEYFFVFLFFIILFLGIAHQFSHYKVKEEISPAGKKVFRKNQRLGGNNQHTCISFWIHYPHTLDTQFGSADKDLLINLPESFPKEIKNIIVKNNKIEVEVMLLHKNFKEFQKAGNHTDITTWLDYLADYISKAPMQSKLNAKSSSKSKSLLKLAFNSDNYLLTFTILGMILVMIFVIYVNAV